MATGNLLSVINVLMQLRKVCNHPNLFEVRQTVSPFQMPSIEYFVASLVWSALDCDPFKVSFIRNYCMVNNILCFLVFLVKFLTHVFLFQALPNITRICN